MMSWYRSMLLSLCAGNPLVTVGGFPAQRASKMQEFFVVNLIMHLNIHQGNEALPSSFGINTLRPRQNGRRFADDTFKRIFLNDNVRISIKISLKFVPKGPIDNIPSLVQIMAWRRSGDKPLSEPMMVSLPTHICVTRTQWVNLLRHSAQFQSTLVWNKILSCCKLPFAKDWFIAISGVQGGILVC